MEEEREGVRERYIERAFQDLIQEFLAALYVFLSFIDTGINLLSEEPPTSRKDTLLLLYQSGVHKALQSENEHLDSFLRTS